ncbi:MAG TPA: toast rack family protein [Bryobacteraceae bacterium]|nr:toast rack family protein [Bryobacteraceae bacterium]
MSGVALPGAAISGVALPLLAVLVSTGCALQNFDDSPPRHHTKAVELDKSEIVRVSIKMGAGELSVSGGSPRLLDAVFDFHRLVSEPLVTYHSTGVRGDLTIEQPSDSGGFKQNHGDYKWDLRLNDRVPMDVVANLGAGEARMKLGDLTLRSVEVHMGVGELNLDLRGNPTRDCDVQIHGGVGEANVYLPASAAITANAKGGIGDISVQGLEKRNGRWINPLHEHAAATIHLDVTGGVGSIHLVAE